MKFDIKNPADWTHVLAGEVIAFPAKGQRNVRFSLNSTQEVTVWVADNPDMLDRVLVGRSSGIFECGFSANGETFVQLESNLAPIIYLRSNARTQFMAGGHGEKYTNVIPQGRRNSDLDRMMMIMKLNEKRRDEQQRVEIDRIRAEFEKQAKAAPTPEPEPEVVEPVTEPEADETEGASDDA
ncbi:hypothetical protein ACSQ8I_21230 [Marinovum sp. E06]|uniref:hypothetical protein n=1 Tax=Marinovum sp. E06 TaxID=3449225 RepID=UPI003EDC8231